MSASQPHVDFGDNLNEVAATLAAERPAKSAKAKTKPESEVERKVRIVLEDNDQVPPGGLFVQINGRSFLIQVNEEVDVPESVIHVLDNAVTSVPIKNRLDQVVAFRDRLRFPYRVIHKRGV